jgi:hypothetical protein
MGEQAREREVGRGEREEKEGEETGKEEARETCTPTRESYLHTTPQPRKESWRE